MVQGGGILSRCVETRYLISNMGSDISSMLAVEFQFQKTEWSTCNYPNVAEKLEIHFYALQFFQIRELYPFKYGRDSKAAQTTTSPFRLAVSLFLCNQDSSQVAEWSFRPVLLILHQHKSKFPMTRIHIKDEASRCTS